MLQMRMFDESDFLDRHDVWDFGNYLVVFRIGTLYQLTCVEDNDYSIISDLAVIQGK